MDKSAVFLDGGYLTKLTKYVFIKEDGKPSKPDFGCLGKKLSEERSAELLRTYYYQCPPYQSSYPTQDEKYRKKQHDTFTYNLKQIKQFQLREGRLLKTFDESGKPDFIQKGVDVLLAIDMVRLALKGAIQKVILVASDSDFIPAVRAIKEEGVMVHIYYYNNREFSFSRELVTECDDRHELTHKHFQDCEMSI